MRALAVGGLALAFAAVVQWAAQRAGASDMELRLAGVVSVVVGNLAMLQWFRSGGGVSHAGNRVFQWLVLGVCALGAVGGLAPPVAAALGLPALPAGPVLLALAVPVAWASWRLLASWPKAGTSRAAS
jgi:Ca2+-transporting ATPase